jgi:hypothetical protein
MAYPGADMALERYRKILRLLRPENGLSRP